MYVINELKNTVTTAGFWIAYIPRISGRQCLTALLCGSAQSAGPETPSRGWVQKTERAQQLAPNR